MQLICHANAVFSHPVGPVGSSKTFEPGGGSLSTQSAQWVSDRRHFVIYRCVLIGAFQKGEERKMSSSGVVWESLVLSSLLSRRHAALSYTARQQRLTHSIPCLPGLPLVSRMIIVHGCLFVLLIPFTLIVLLIAPFQSGICNLCLYFYILT